MDDKDIYKATTTSGYMDIKNISLSGVKNEEMFNKAIIDAYTNNKGFDFDPTAKRVAVIINASDKTKLAIDNTFNVLFKYTGDPKITGEFFKHIQYDPEEPEYISVIASGIRIPDKEFVKINNKFEEIKSKRENNNVSYSAAFRMGIDDDGEFFVEQSYSGPIYDSDFIRDKYTKKYGRVNRLASGWANLICSINHSNYNSHYGKHSNKSGNKSISKLTCRNQCAYLIYKKSNCVTY